MQSLWLEDGRFSLRDDIEYPSPGEGELVVKVRYAGICGTDMALRAGYYAFRGIPGHEFTGTVVAGPDEWIGARIVSSINITCGQCEFCRQGMGSHCRHRQVIGIKDRPGAFAEYVCVPIANSWRLPDEIGDRDAALVEPLAAALEIPAQVRLDPRGRVLVVGAGRLGQLIVQVLAGHGATVEVLVRNERRRSDMVPLDVRCIVADDLTSNDYDLVVECTGRPAGFAMALNAVRPRGTLVMKSTYADPLTIDASGVVVDEISLVGSRCGPFGEAIEWLRAGKVGFSHLTFREFPLSAFEQAFDTAGDPSVYKVLFDPSR